MDNPRTQEALVTDNAIRILQIQYYLQFCVGGLMFYLRYLCLFAHSGVQHILCCGFFSSSSVLPVSLDSSFLMAPSIFSSV